MKNLTTLFYLIFASYFALSQNTHDDFKIGIFGVEYLMQNGVVPNQTILDGKNTSSLNVLSEDGFNGFSSYSPDYYTTSSNLERILQLANLNDMQIITNLKDWYKANPLNKGTAYHSDGTMYYHSTLSGTNHYNSSSGDHPNFDYFMDNIYHQPQYKHTIWGHQICEESSYWNLHNSTNVGPIGAWPPSNFIESEVPLPNVLDALNHFKSKLLSNNISHQKLMVWEACHSQAITQNLSYDGENNNPNQQYVSRHLIEALNPNTVYFEGSYHRFPQNWQNQNYSVMYNGGPDNTYHYLGSFKTIDFAKSKVNSVHQVMSASVDNPAMLDHVHSNLLIRNANWMWFQAYTAIIHGVEGIWFWDLSSSWEFQEKPSNWNSNTARFNRDNFSCLYKNFISNLSRELRYLVNNGFLDSDPNKILYVKRDNADANCIVPPASNYIPANLPTEKKNENYGLRYTIRTNGEEVIMIVSNPLGTPVTATLNFNDIANPVIRNAIGVEVLFANNSAVTSSDYKVNRNSSINLVNNTVGNKYLKLFSTGKNLTLNFGPMDVHILKFKSLVPVVNNDGWGLLYSNYGNGSLGNWRLRDNDLLYPGDYDGDGVDEIFCVNTGNNTMSVLKFQNDNWTTSWTSNNPTHMMLPYRDNFLVGDFDGDGKDELFGNDVDGWTTMFNFDSNNWVWGWSDYGSHVIRDYKEQLTAGDFNGDGRTEIIGTDLPSGLTTIFRFENGNWNFLWSDNASHPIRSYRNKLESGDFDGDGKDDILGIGNAAGVFSFANNNLSMAWNNLGTNTFGGWSYPFPSSDQLLIGNIDYTDKKEEILLIQSGNPAGWATSLDWKKNKSDWNWNWSANDSYSTPYIYDWPISNSNGSQTKYILFKPYYNQPKHLIAIRKFGCSGANYNYLFNIYYPHTNTNKSHHYFDSEADLLPSSTKNNTTVSIYPNPTTGLLFVKSSDSVEKIELYSMDGRLIQQQFCSTDYLVNIDINNYPTGLYLVKVKTTDSITYCRVQLN